MKFNMPTCGGCRTCEIACSFRHTGEFTPAVSSIKILDKGNEPGFVVSLFEEDKGLNRACDGCKELEVPLCMQYCRERDELEKILEEFMKKAKKEVASG